MTSFCCVFTIIFVENGNECIFFDAINKISNVLFGQSIGFWRCKEPNGPSFAFSIEDLTDNIARYQSMLLAQDSQMNSINERIMNNAESSVFLADDKEDIELTWYLMLFAELVYTRGDVLLIYKKMIMSIFHRCIRIINKNSCKVLARTMKNLLESLTHVYPLDSRLTTENLDQPLSDFLPIRVSSCSYSINYFHDQLDLGTICGN